VTTGRPGTGFVTSKGSLLSVGKRGSPAGQVSAPSDVWMASLPFADEPGRSVLANILLHQHLRQMPKLRPSPDFVEQVDG